MLFVFLWFSSLPAAESVPEARGGLAGPERYEEWGKRQKTAYSARQVPAARLGSFNPVFPNFRFRLFPAKLLQCAS